MTKTITILGSTGSIGRQTLSVADELGLRVAALTAERNVELIGSAVPPIPAGTGRSDGRSRRGGIKSPSGGYEYKGARGRGGAVRGGELCRRPIRSLWPCAALPRCGPRSTAIREKKRIALANKETMVCAGRDHAGCRAGIRCGDHPRRFRALGHFPVPHGMPGQSRGQTPDFNLLRRAVLRKDAGRAGLYDQIRRAAPSELENGRENHG